MNHIIKQHSFIYILSAILILIIAVIGVSIIFKSANGYNSHYAGPSALPSAVANKSFNYNDNVDGIQATVKFHRTTLTEDNGPGGENVTYHIKHIYKKDDGNRLDIKFEGSNFNLYMLYINFHGKNINISGPRTIRNENDLQ